MESHLKQGKCRQEYKAGSWRRYRVGLCTWGCRLLTPEATAGLGHYRREP